MVKLFFMWSFFTFIYDICISGPCSVSILTEEVLNYLLSRLVSLIIFLCVFSLSMNCVCDSFSFYGLKQITLTFSLLNLWFRYFCSELCPFLTFSYPLYSIVTNQVTCLLIFFLAITCWNTNCKFWEFKFFFLQGMFLISSFYEFD